MQSTRFMPLMLLAVLAGNAPASGETDRAREIECLALNIYHEARNQPESGKYAVGVVTMNRVQDEGYPDTVCAVVWEKRWSSRLKRYVPQFSWTLDGKSDRPREHDAWKDAQKIATQVYSVSSSTSPVGDAMYYHASYVSPGWAQRLTRVARIGQHIFYR